MHLTSINDPKPVTTTPDEKNITKMDMIAAEERFRQIVAGSYFSSMRMGVCAFSGDILPIETVGHFAMTGCDNTHPIPRGFIQCGTEYEYLMPICSFKNMINNKMLAVEYTDLPENVKIPRSKRKGETTQRISEGFISKNSSIYISTRSKNLNVKVMWDDEETKICSTKDCNLKQFLELNGVSSVKISPKIYSDEFISMQPENVAQILSHYNREFKTFVEEVVLERFQSLDINYTFEYSYCY